MPQDDPPTGDSTLSEQERATVERLRSQLAKTPKTRTLSQSFIDKMTSASVDPAWDGEPRVSDPSPNEPGGDASSSSDI